MQENLQPKRLLVVGDIHGYLDKLTELMEQVQPMEHDKVVFLGDYIDRGPDSRGVIEYLIDFRQRFPQTVFLRGNHEQMLLDALVEDRIAKGQHSEGMRKRLRDYPSSNYFSIFSTSDTERYMANDGNSTLRNYGGDFGDILKEHENFLESCRFWHRETVMVADIASGIKQQEFIFVHAGIRPGKPIEDQTPEDLLWIRDEFLDSKDNFGGSIIVHGHSFEYEEVPVIRTNRIGMDNAAYMDPQISHYYEDIPGKPGQLVCLDVISKESWRSCATKLWIRDS